MSAAKKGSVGSRRAAGSARARPATKSTGAKRPAAKVVGAKAAGAKRPTAKVVGAKAAGAKAAGAKAAGAKAAGAKAAGAKAAGAKAAGAKRPAAEPSAAKQSAKQPGAVVGRSLAERRAHAAAVLAALRGQHPDAHCELIHDSAWTLLVATVLSAQTTDKLVNKVTPDLFARWPTPAALGAADPAEVASFLHARGMGFHNVKGKNIVGLAQAVVRDHAGQVPGTMESLTKLPGVGRKTANLILGECFGGGEGVVVDTHVLRLTQRLGLSASTKPELTEQELAELYPKAEWLAVSHTLIFHGRRICLAVRPACASCQASELCPSAFDAVHVGRK